MKKIVLFLYLVLFFSSFVLYSYDQDKALKIYTNLDIKIQKNNLDYKKSLIKKLNELYTNSIDNENKQIYDYIIKKIILKDIKSSKLEFLPNLQNQNIVDNLLFDTKSDLQNHINNFDRYISNNKKNIDKYVKYLFMHNYLILFQKTLNKYLRSNIVNYDFLTDTSYQKFVWIKTSFTDKQYYPTDLVEVRKDYISIWKKCLLRKQSEEQLFKLSQNYYKYFWKKLELMSCFRDYNYQKNIAKTCDETWCARAWFSEHQSWLAIDLFNVSFNQKQFVDNYTKNKQKVSEIVYEYEIYRWFANNAYKYGFHNSYQNWPELDGYNIESWHWRYLWVDLATYLYENNITYTQFINKK